MYVRLKVAEIIVPQRLRQIDRAHVERLKPNMRRVGLLEPVVVGGDGVLICGAHRLQAAREIGWEEIDCHVVGEVSDALLLEMAENALRKPYTPYELYFYIRQRWEAASEASSGRMGRRKKGQTQGKGLGKTTEVIGRECGISGEQVRRIKLIGDTALSDSRYLGFLEDLKRKKLNRVWRRFHVRHSGELAMKGAGPLPDAEDAATPSGTHALQPNKLYLGDCRELLPRLADRSVHAVICDPPYGRGLHKGAFRDVADNPDDYGEWLRPVVAECRRVTVPGGLLAFFVPSDLRYLERSRGWFGQDARLLVGVKAAAKGYSYQTPVVPAFDAVVLCFNGGARPLTPEPTTARRDWFESCMRFDPEARLAPYPKCLDLCEYLVEAFTVPGGVVLDPTMGSGSVPIAASRKGRRYLGIEIDPDAYDLARLRVRKYGSPGYDYWGRFGKAGGGGTNHEPEREAALA